MGVVTPFADDAVAELKLAGRAIICGEVPTSVTREPVKRWSAMIQAFLDCVDRKTGSLLHFPFSGGRFEQPSKTMMVFEVLQGVFIEMVNDQIRKSMEQTRSR